MRFKQVSSNYIVKSASLDKTCLSEDSVIQSIIVRFIISNFNKMLHSRNSYTYLETLLNFHHIQLSLNSI